MYSVALLNTCEVSVSLCFAGQCTCRKPTVALFSLCAGVRPWSSSLSSVVSSPLALLDSTRRLGTLSRSAAILSFKLVLYRFSIILCAVFLTGCWLSSSSSSSRSSKSAEDLRLRLPGFDGSGEPPLWPSPLLD